MPFFRPSCVTTFVLIVMSKTNWYENMRRIYFICKSIVAPLERMLFQVCQPKADGSIPLNIGRKRNSHSLRKNDVIYNNSKVFGTSLCEKNIHSARALKTSFHDYKLNASNNLFTFHPKKILADRNSPITQFQFYFYF